MFEGLKNLGQMASIMKQAQQIGGRLQGLNDELKTRRVQGTAGGGLVTVEASGLGEVVSCRIDPSLTSDREMLEELLPAAINNALLKAKQLHAESFQSLTGGMDMSALNEMAAKLSGNKPETSD